MTATITEARAKIAPMMLRTIVIESVLSGEAELVGATGFTLAGVAVPKPWVLENDDMMSCQCRGLKMGHVNCVERKRWYRRSCEGTDQVISLTEFAA